MNAPWPLLLLLACGSGADSGAADSAARDLERSDLPLFVNEFMASNQAAVPDGQGGFPDWLEIYNAGDEAVDLGGFTITDDLQRPDRHIFPDTLALEPGAFLLLWADGDVASGDTHLSFRLAAAGEAIGLFTPEGALIDEVEYPQQRPDVSEARVPDGADNWESAGAGTPGASNG